MDITEAIPEPDATGIFTGDARHMVWHDHVGIVNRFEGTQRFEHIHIAFVWKDLDEIEETALDVAKVDVKQLLSLTEVAENIVEISTWIFERFRHRSDAEIQSMVRALMRMDEFLETFNRAHDSGNTPI